MVHWEDWDGRWEDEDGGRRGEDSVGKHERVLGAIAQQPQIGSGIEPSIAIVYIASDNRWFPRVPGLLFSYFVFFGNPGHKLVT